MWTYLVSKFLYCISFLLFMQTFFNHEKETFLISLTTPICVGSQILWFNSYITIDNNSVHFKESSHNINFINQLFTSKGGF